MALHTRRHGTDTQSIERFLLLVCSLTLVVLQCLPLHSALLYGRATGQKNIMFAYARMQKRICKPFLDPET